MNDQSPTVKAYRVTWGSGKTIQYANRLADGDFPRVRWSPLSVEYPDHFTMREVKQILAFYSDQKLDYYDVRLRKEDD